MKRVAIIGCGAIGSVIAETVARGEVGAELSALIDLQVEKCEHLVKKIGVSTKICRDLECLLSSKPDIVVEAASQKAVKEYLPELLSKGVDVVVLSVGALLDKELLEIVNNVGRSSRARIYVPSGAIAGIDALKAVSLVGVERVVLRTTKNVRSFDPEILRRLGVEIRETLGKVKIFSGSASEAVKLFPANINVVAALALATGVEPFVEIYADPSTDVNIHEIEVESKVSKLYIRVANKPHPQNPRTSYLAALSALKLLKRLCEESILEVGV